MYLKVWLDFGVMIIIMKGTFKKKRMKGTYRLINVNYVIKKENKYLWNSYFSL